MNASEMQPRQWSVESRRWVATILLVMGGMLVYQIREVLPIFILSSITAYLLNPPIDAVGRRLGSRTWGAIVVYVGLVALAIVLAVLLASGLASQLQSVQTLGPDIKAAIDALETRLQTGQSTVSILGSEVEIAPLYSWLRDQLDAIEGATLGRQSLSLLMGFASGFAFTLIGLLAALFLSFYMAKDADVLGRRVHDMVPAAYREAYRELREEIALVWRYFFRGQLILGLVVGTAVASVLLVLGVRHALLLALLAGLLEIIPNLGPILAAMPAILIALVQGSSTFQEVSPMWLAAIVTLAYVVIQQVENNVLVPRIIGRSVSLAPGLALAGVLGGAVSAGILGILLAAPVIASARVIGRWLGTQLLAESRASEAAAAAVEDAPPAAAFEPVRPAATAAGRKGRPGRAKAGANV